MRDLGRLTVSIIQNIAGAAGTSAALRTSGGAGRLGLLGGLLPASGLTPGTYAYRSTQAVHGAMGALGRSARRENAALDFAEFIRRPTGQGAKNLLGGDFGDLLKVGKFNRFGPLIATTVSSIGKLGSVALIAGIAFGAMAVAIKKAADTVNAFVDRVGRYSARISAAQAKSEAGQERAKIRYGRSSLSTISAAEFVKALGKLGESVTRLLAAVTPIFSALVIPVVQALTVVADAVSWIFELCNKSFTVFAVTLGAILIGVGILTAVLTGFTIAGAAIGTALIGIGLGVAAQGVTLGQIEKNTRPTEDWSDANAPFLADLRLMGATI